MANDRRVGTRGYAPVSGGNAPHGGRPGVGSLKDVRQVVERVAVYISEPVSGAPIAERIRAQTELRDAVRALAVRLRGEATPPQRMLVLLKDMVRHSSPPGLASTDQRELTDAIVRWSIDAYYAA